ncbi:MAG: LamG-like jellyroll fold domain-containing protein [Verrucomicrobiota bacterium]
MRSSRGIMAAWFASGSLCWGALEVAGSLLVDLDATDFSGGAEKWQQHSSGTEIAGNFIPKGSPTRQVVAGADAVVFDGDGDCFVGPLTTAALHGPGAKHSVEVWVYQGNVRDQESIVSWGKRWGPNLTFAGFRYGADPDFGAVARWGASESAFTVVPPAGHWHHLVSTYDGKTQSIYVDGKLDNSKAVGLLDAHDRLPIHLGAEICGDLKLEGQFTQFSGALAKVRIHSGALLAAQVKHNYEADLPGFPGLAGESLKQSPMHRFSFNEAAGPAPDGSTVIDRIGGLAAVIRGTDAKFTGSAVELPGGSSGTAAYVDFPNGLISSRENLSIEFWETQTAEQAWCRILSIGTNQVGEISGPGGTFAGSETLTLFGNVGMTQVNRFARSVGTYPNGGPDRDPVDYPESDYGVEFHQVITYNMELREWHWYRNAILMEVIPDEQGPTTIDDVNVWLGRSEFSNDNNFRGLFNEFRIYNRALSEGEIHGNFLAGPDKINLGGRTVAFNWTPVESGSHKFANSSGSDQWNTGAGGAHPNGSGVIATLASAIAGDQEILFDFPLALGTLNLGARGANGAFILRGKDAAAITMDSGNSVAASINQLPGSPGNFIHAPVSLRSDTEVANPSSSALVISGAIRGNGSFIKSGSGPVILTGDGGGYDGLVRVVAGALVLGDGGTSGQLAASHYTINDPGQLIFNRSDSIELSGSFGGSGGIIHQGRGKLLLGKGGSFANSGDISLLHGSGTFTSEGIIDGPATLVADTGVILRGQSSTRVREYFSIGTKQAGTLTLQDSASIAVDGRGHFNLGDIGGGSSTMFMKGGSVSCKELHIGKYPDTSGVLLQSGGEIRAIGQFDSRVGGASYLSWQSWGAWRMTGGTYTDEWNLQIGTCGIGVMEIDGGHVDVGGFLAIGRYQDDQGHPSHGVVDVKSGSVTTSAAENLLLVGEEGVGVLNIRGRGTVICANRMIIGAGTIDKSGDGTVNLLTGGTLVTSGIGQMNQTEAVGRLNLDGGTLKVGKSSEAFLEGLDYVFVRKGGARIDTNGFDARINQPLLAPRGNGIPTIPVIRAGAGYLGAPWIEIAGGGGSGATAVADLVDGSIKSITITHPGNDYISAPAVSILGGGSGSGLTLGTPVLAANVSGGLVKTGAGTLTLGGANSYTGVTSVMQGSLRVEGHLAGGVEVAAGAALGGRGSVGAAVEVVSGSTLSPDPGGVLAVRGNVALHGTFILRTAGTSAGRLDVADKLDLTGSKLVVEASAAKVASPVHLIASYGSLRGKFALDDSLPAGYSLDYHYNGHNQIALVATAADGE